MLIQRDDICVLLGYDDTISDSDLAVYQQAFVHRSCEDQQSQERLEWIGDCVLGMAVSKFLFDTYTDMNEGYLTKYRTKIVSGTTLASLGNKLGLSQFIQMDLKSQENRYYMCDKVIEDTLEAFIGSIYIVRGFVSAKRFVLTRLIPQLDLDKLLTTEINWKDCLMRQQQRFALELPTYSLIQSYVSEQEVHGVMRKIKFFQMQASIYCKNGDTVSGFAIGKTKKIAEQQAAYNVLELLKL
jgi:ribonuclease-3